MKIHRFYTDDIDLQQSMWVHSPELLKQWLKVLRFRVDQQLVMFDGVGRDRLYKIVEIKPDEVKLELVTEFEPKLPKKEVYLFWSLLKKDKNDWVIQKCTELGVSHFVPILAGRSEKTGFNLDRAKKISVEAAEQCGRSDIPKFREPISLDKALAQYHDKAHLFICEQSETDNIPGVENDGAFGVFVGPEGGWADEEKQLFISQKVDHLNLHDFTLRAETACVTAVHNIMSI